MAHLITIVLGDSDQLAMWDAVMPSKSDMNSDMHQDDDNPSLLFNFILF
jgi:hypothetical protein